MNEVVITEEQNISQSDVASQEPVSDNQCGQQEMGGSVVMLPAGDGEDSTVLDEFVSSPECTVIHRRSHFTRAQRLQRRNRIALRKRMLSFEEPERPTVFKRLILPGESSDECDVPEEPSQPTVTHKTSRKRKRNEARWKRNAIKRARETGSSYTSYTGELVPEKTAPVDVPLCPEKCRLKCSSRISNASRQELFDAYYSLNCTAQDVHLFQCISSRKPKLHLADASNQRLVTIYYTVVVDGGRVRVCKTAFQRMHSITKGKVDHIVRQHKAGLTTAVPSRRGMHSNRPNRVSEGRLEFVREHIRSFPADVSHYSRSCNPNRLYLSPTLSTNSMYDMYVGKCRESSEVPVSLKMYRDVFTGDFNLGFGSPKSDTCSRCETL